MKQLKVKEESECCSTTFVGDSLECTFLPLCVHVSLLTKNLSSEKEKQAKPEWGVHHPNVVQLVPFNGIASGGSGAFGACAIPFEYRKWSPKSRLSRITSI